MITTADRIRTIRNQRGWSQQTTAKKLGWAQQTLQRYEAGVIRPGVDKIIKMANVFNCTTDYLLCVSESPENTGVNTLETLDLNIIVNLHRPTYRNKELTSLQRAILIYVLELLQCIKDPTD